MWAGPCWTLCWFALFPWARTQQEPHGNKTLWAQVKCPCLYHPHRVSDTFRCSISPQVDLLSGSFSSSVLERKQPVWVELQRGDTGNEHSQLQALLASGLSIGNSIPGWVFHPSRALPPPLCARNLEAAAVLSKGVDVDEVLQDRGGTLSFLRCFLQRHSMGGGHWDPWPGMAMAAMELETKTPLTQLRQGLKAQAWA